MAGQHGDFGSGSIERDGIRWGVHYWPVAGFKLHFTDEHEFRNLDFKCEEDWKAAIYAWGGPKPSWISRTKIDFDRENMLFMIMYLEKRFDPELKSNGLQQERSLDQPSEVPAGSDGGGQD
jgi:hypothetical protein